MMNIKCILLIFLCFILSSFKTFNKDDLSNLRKDFFEINGDLTIAQEIYDESLKTQKQSAVFMAYLGTLQAMLAGNKSNPFSKLSWFNKGKATIENAIKQEPNNPEIRFLRLSVQLKTPSFLFYYGDIDVDKKIVINQNEYFKRIGIQKEVNQFLIENAELTKEEKTRLNN